MSKLVTEYDAYECPLLGDDTPENRKKAAAAKEKALKLAKELDEKYAHQGEKMPRAKLYKNNPTDKIWWVDTSDKDGGFNFTFDKKTFFNMFQDYPHNLSLEQKEIFDKENPFWKDFFSDQQ